MPKEKIINTLNEIADILEIKGENAFKCKAYRNGAKALEIYEGDFDELLKNDRIADLPGIGKGLAEKIIQIYETGTTQILEELKQQVPAGIIDMLQISGLGPKKVKVIYDNLGITTISELEYACLENKVSALSGFGEKTQEKILKGIELLKKSAGRYLYAAACDVADKIVRNISALKEVKRIQVAGSLRRCKETVKDIDILVSSDKPGPVMERFTSMMIVSSVVAKGHTKSSVIVEEGIAADLRVVSDEQFAPALNYFTGSKEHNVILRQRAIRRGMKLNEYGLFRTKGDKEEVIPCANEEEIYKHLDLPYIPPELREGRGEVEFAEINSIPDLVTAEDIKGVFHIHSTFSDGLNSIEEIVFWLKGLGLTYAGISDHSVSAHYANGLSPEKVLQQFKLIDDINAKIKNFKILKGIESDIHKDGSLDYNDEILSQFDFVIGSIHTNFNMNEKEMTQRIINAVSNPHITMLGHMTGRLLLMRDAYPVNVDAVIEAAAKHKVIIEINSNPYRLDLDWRQCKKVIEAGVMLSINPDAHRIEGLDDYKLGVGIARKGWCRPADIFNTKTIGEIEEYLAQRKKT